MNIQEITALKNLVRIGKVSSVNADNHTARVAFADKQDVDGKALISGPLQVIKNTPTISGEDVISPWLPSVGQLVLCLYLANGESDGFVLGGI